MPERPFVSPQHIREQPFDALETFLKGMSLRAETAALDLWKNASQELQHTSPEMVVVTPIAMHDETDVEAYLQQLRGLQRPDTPALRRHTPDFWTVLSCNAPQRMSTAQQRQYQRNMDSIHDFRKRNPAYPLTFFEAEYPTATTIGEIRRDLIEATLSAVSAAHGTHQIGHLLIVSSDVDTAYLSPRYLEVARREYQREQRYGTAMCLFPSVKHARQPDMPNADAVVAWFDLENRLTQRTLSGHVVFDAATYLYGDGYAADASNEVWHMWARAKAAAEPDGVGKNGFRRLPGMWATVSSRRLYAQMASWPVRLPEQRLNYDAAIGITPQSEHRIAKPIDISERVREEYLWRFIPEILGEVAQIHYLMSLRRQPTQNRVEKQLRVKDALAYSTRIGQLAIATLGGWPGTIDKFAERKVVLSDE